jgi:hypothetical protein
LPFLSSFLETQTFSTFIDEAIGTIYILRKQFLGHFLTHPPKMIYFLIDTALTEYERPKMKKDARQKRSKKTAFWRASLFIFDGAYFVKHTACIGF